MTTQADVDAAKAAWDSAKAVFNPLEAQSESLNRQSLSIARQQMDIQDNLHSYAEPDLQFGLQAQMSDLVNQQHSVENQSSLVEEQLNAKYSDVQAKYQAYQATYAALNGNTDSTTYDSTGNPITATISPNTEVLSNIDATPVPTISAVSSGSGVGANATAVAAGDYAYGSLGSGTAGGLGNAALVDVNAVYPNTEKTTISKTQLNTADTNYTTAMNTLQGYITNGDTSSDAYMAAKQNALTAQYRWELARNNLQEVASTESGNTQNLSDNLANQPSDGNLSDVSTSDSQLVSTPTLSYDMTGLNSDATVTSGTQTNNSNTLTDVNTSLIGADQRVRVSPMGIQNQSWMYSGICSVLKSTGGVVFPYTPTISYNHKADYQKMTPTHSNTEYYVYSNTPAVVVTVEAQFTAQNSAEAAYLLAAMHFFRTATKMHFGAATNAPGASIDDAGLPPPVLVLSGYGNMMFNNLSVVLTDFSMAMPNNVDYVEVSVSNDTANSSAGAGQSNAKAAVAWVPAVTTFNLTFAVQQTPKKQREEFNFGLFASGNLMINNTGWL